MKELREFTSFVIDYRGKTPLKLGLKWSSSGYRALSAKNIKTGRIVNEDSIYHGDETLYKAWMKDEIRRGDILITSEAPFGEVFYWDSDEKIILSQRLFCLRPQNILPQFLYYAMTSRPFQSELLSRATGTTVTGLRQPELLKCMVPVKSSEEQQHIVDILGSIDEKIENNEQLINIFENLAAKKYLDFANKTSTKIRLEDVIELFDSKRIPLSSREREQRKGIYPYYGATGILDYVNGFLFSGEYVLFAEDGTVTDTNGHPIVQLVNGSFWVNNHAHILKGKNGWNDYTLYVALKQINVDKAVTGAVQPKINQANLLSLEIPNLSNNNLQTINTELDVVFHKVFHLRSENKELQELKGLYLKKFFE